LQAQFLFLSGSLLLNVGGSAAALRALRNGAQRLGSKGEKDGRPAVVLPNCGTQFAPYPYRRPSFSPSSPDSAHHSAANAVSERNLQQKVMIINHQSINLFY